MVKVIRTYHGKLGVVTVTMYDEDGRTMYHVEHSYKPLCSHAWFIDRTEAIVHAQFLAGKY